VFAFINKSMFIYKLNLHLWVKTRVLKNQITKSTKIKIVALSKPIETFLVDG